MRRVALLYHPNSPEVAGVISQVTSLVERAGLSLSTSPISEDSPPPWTLDEAELLITLGGDGTVLRGASLAFPRGIPILGINLGHLGFLTEIEPGEIDFLLPRALAGDFWLDERMMLEVSILRQAAEVLTAHALSDAVIRRGASGQALRVSISIDELPFIHYTADGVILSTPTGSTGYCLAAGGAIIHPHLPSISLTAISAHLMPLRSFVLPPEVEIKVHIASDAKATLSLDGAQDTPLSVGDAISLQKSPHSALFARVHPLSHFYRNLIPRLVRGIAER